MIADEISKKLQKYILTHSNDVIIPNFYFGGWEMDVCKITGISQYVTEYEIKTSRSDYFNDKNKGDKHFVYECGAGKPNKFYYVVPDDLIKPSEVPIWAGLIYYPRFNIVKSARFLHKKVINCKDWRHIAIKLKYRYFSLLHKYEHLKSDRSWIYGK